MLTAKFSQTNPNFYKEQKKAQICGLSHSPIRLAQRIELKQSMKVKNQVKRNVEISKSTKINNSLRSLASELDFTGFDEIEQMIRLEDGGESNSSSI